MKILLMAGEVSGDYQASFLARALREREPSVEISGTGGAHMKNAGVRLSHETVHLSSVGFLEPIRHILPLRGIYRDVTRVVREERPDVAVLVDNQGFNLAVAKVLRSLSVPVIFYFPPQIWVGPFLFAHSVARNSRLVISAFPLEAKIYREKYGANAVSFGHPLLDIAKPASDADARLRGLGLDPAVPLVGLMPGSRPQEVKVLARPMLEAARILLAENSSLQFVLPVAAEHVKAKLAREVAAVGLDAKVKLVEGDAYTPLSRCEVVLACSGTATLELSLFGVPSVVAYRLDPASHWIARKLSITPYVAMPNVLLEEMVVPEIIQYRITGEHFAARAKEVLGQPDRARRIRARLAEIPSHLGSPGGVGLAADRILNEARRARLAA
jgi:lipid-A-disaccharide synthase